MEPGQGYEKVQDGRCFSIRCSPVNHFLVRCAPSETALHRLKKDGRCSPDAAQMWPCSGAAQALICQSFDCLMNTFRLMEKVFRNNSAQTGKEYIIEQMEKGVTE